MVLNESMETDVNIELTHRFLKTAHDLPAILNGCNKLATFTGRLEKQADWHPDRYDPDSYKGDGFELFVEALIKLSPVDNRIGIHEYQVESGQDIGVDGYGIGTDGRPATVQVKYRSKNDTHLTANADHLTNFTSSSVMHYDVDPKSAKNMLIITTAEGLHHFTDGSMFKGRVRCIGIGGKHKEGLRSIVDNNRAFWDQFRELVENSIV